MHADATDDPLHSMTVERVTRPDGRYLIYYDWPIDRPSVDGDPSSSVSPPGDADDV